MSKKKNLDLAPSRRERKTCLLYTHLAGRKSDKEHPYGHERMECVAAIVLATVLAVTGIGTVSYTHLDVYKRQQVFRRIMTRCLVWPERCRSWTSSRLT